MLNAKGTYFIKKFLMKSLFHRKRTYTGTFSSVGDDGSTMANWTLTISGVRLTAIRDVAPPSSSSSLKQAIERIISYDRNCLSIKILNYVQIQSQAMAKELGSRMGKVGPVKYIFLPHKGTTILYWLRPLSIALNPTENRIHDFSRLLSDFPVLFNADLIFKYFSRKPSKFKFFSSLCKPWTRSEDVKHGIWSGSVLFSYKMYFSNLNEIETYQIQNGYIQLIIVGCSIKGINVLKAFWKCKLMPYS